MRPQPNCVQFVPVVAVRLTRCQLDVRVMAGPEVTETPSYRNKLMVLPTSAPANALTYTLPVDVVVSPVVFSDIEERSVPAARLKTIFAAVLVPSGAVPLLAVTVGVTPPPIENKIQLPLVKSVDQMV